jgi:hypothetical protein
MNLLLAVLVSLLILGGFVYARWGYGGGFGGGFGLGIGSGVLAILVTYLFGHI